MATVNENIDININGSQALASLRNIERSVDTLANGFREFMTGVAEGMAGALASTNKTKAGIDAMTKSMQGLGAATDKVNLGKKIGGQAGDANKSVSELSKSVGAAAGKFTSLEGIVGGFVLGNFIKNTYQASENMIGLSAANNTAAQASASVSANMFNLQQAFVNVLQPLNELIANTSVSIKTFEKLIIVIASAIGAFAAFRALRLVTAAMGSLQTVLTTTSAGLYGIGKAAGQAWAGMLRFLGIGEGVAKIAGLSGKLFTFAGVFAAILRVLLRFAGIAGIIISVVEAVNLLIKAFTGFDVLDWIWDKLGKVITRLKEFIGLQKDQEQPKNTDAGIGAGAGVGVMDAFRKMEAAGYDETNKALKEQEDARRQLGKQLAQDLQNLRLQNAATLQQLQLETQLVGKTEEQAELARVIAQIEQQRVQAVAQLRGRIAAGEDAKLLGGQIAAVNRLYEEQKNRITGAVQKLQDAKLLEQDRLNTLQRISAEYERQQNINQAMGNIFGGLGAQQSGMNFERSLMGKGAGEKDLFTKRRDLQLQYAQAAGQLIEAFSVDGEIVDVQRYTQAVKQLDDVFEKLHKTLNDNTAAQNRWSTGWQEAWANFRETINNEALTAQQQFDAVIGNMMSALDNFVKTGKLNFKDLVGSIIKDLTALALKRAIFNALDIGGWGGFFGKLIGAGASMLTGGAYVGPASAGGRATAASAGTTNNYYVSAIDSRSVAQFFAEHRRTVYGTVMQAEKESPTRARFR